MLCCVACPYRFQCILEYVEKPLSKLTADMGAVLAKTPCSRHIFQMNLEPPAAPAVFPAPADVMTAAKGVPYQQGESAFHQPGAANQQTETTAHARYGMGTPQSREAALTGPDPNMQHQPAGMHHNV